MKYVIGVDLGTSAVKIILVNQHGAVVQQVSKDYPLIQEKSGYSEQNPQAWLDQTVAGLSELLMDFDGNREDIEGISFSGQMHGLVLLDKNHDVLRNAILWNDTRTTAECQEITETIGKERLLEITKNPALEGFTLPKILWVKKHEPEIFQQVATFVLPKDYVRYRLTGKLQMEYSDAAGTLLLHVSEKTWSTYICKELDIPLDICPPLVESCNEVGVISADMAKITGLSPKTRVFAGGADNACGAIGAGILEEGKTLCSIGTSGVILSYESRDDLDFEGKVHYFNHGAPNSYYSMGVTLAAGHSLSWFKDTFAKDVTFEDLLEDAGSVPIGSNGLLFTPFITGERTPYADAEIRASFIGIDSSHTRKHFVRAVMEGITFSLNESVHIFRQKGREIHSIVSIGGGAKDDVWLQIQAEVFNAEVIKLSSEQGPGMGAAMIAAYGCGWFESLKNCADHFLQVKKVFTPIPENVKKYQSLFSIYQDIYIATKNINKKLVDFRL
ncbi:xylulokinase [Pseudalkalibacillus salsuginis]|uniref:xylulokinase n=1 Tax=Pseudalkalibacillus salsuginis TaxID=2910972 RepID=UPI001F4911F1|nr:xylulokinase [Pseudalkalibacillus salsuginis]MCF6409638.1 xylulokinase [Pseudalkalibacillus salsuginis]